MTDFTTTISISMSIHTDTVTNPTVTLTSQSDTVTDYTSSVTVQDVTYSSTIQYTSDVYNQINSQAYSLIEGMSATNNSRFNMLLFWINVNNLQYCKLPYPSSLVGFNWFNKRTVEHSSSKRHSWHHLFILH